MRGACRTIDLGPHRVARSALVRPLIHRKPLDRRLFQSAGEPCHWVAIVELVEVALAIDDVRGHVEPRPIARPREGDVAPLLQAGFAGAEDEGPVDGHALSAVARQRIGMAGVPCFEVAAAQLDAVAAIGRDGERAAPRVDALDRATRAVLDAEPIAVSEADDAVARSELTAGDGEPLATEPA